jgi:cytochrome c oxidase subunit 4
MSDSLSQSHEIAAPVADDVKGAHGAHEGAHAVPRRILIAVYAALLICTAITVAVSQIDLGEFNIVVALAVAVVKGALVALFFMHLFWDQPFNGVVLIAALLFVALFIGIALMDVHAYQVNMNPPQTVHVVQ